MIDSDGNSAITVKKSELLAELTKNRASHRTFFEEAQAGYREAVIKELDAMLDEAKAGRAYRKVVSLPEPVDHTRDYDRVIKMLNMCTKDEMLITEPEFAMYVMDDWSWKRDFVTVGSNYTNNRR